MASVRKPRLLDIDGETEATEGASASYEHMQEEFAKFQAPFAEAMNDVSRKWSEAGKEAQEEWMSFWQQRLQANSQIGEQLVKCKSWPEVFEVQQGWSRIATEQYSAYLTRLSEIMRDSFTRGLDATKTSRFR